MTQNKEICSICRSSKGVKKLSCCQHVLHDECYSAYLDKNPTSMKNTCLICFKEFDITNPYKWRDSYESILKPVNSWVYWITFFLCTIYRLTSEEPFMGKLQQCSTSLIICGQKYVLKVFLWILVLVGI